MLNRSLFVVFSLFAVAQAFTVVSPSIKRSSTWSSLSMFDSNNNSNNKASSFPSTTSPLQPLETVSAADATEGDAATAAALESLNSKSVVKDMNTGEVKEVKWVDSAMEANTNPFNLGWAYLFVFFPAILLLNDFFHFLDPEGPLGFLTMF